jgi:hypothetical protein
MLKESREMIKRFRSNYFTSNLRHSVHGLVEPYDLEIIYEYIFDQLMKVSNKCQLKNTVLNDFVLGNDHVVQVPQLVSIVTSIDQSVDIGLTLCNKDKREDQEIVFSQKLHKIQKGLFNSYGIISRELQKSEKNGL